MGAMEKRQCGCPPKIVGISSLSIYCSLPVPAPLQPDCAICNRVYNICCSSRGRVVKMVQHDLNPGRVAHILKQLEIDPAAI